MNHNYATAFRSFCNEFRMYKQSPSINHATTTAVMDPERLNPGLFGIPDAASYAASLSVSALSQRVTPISTHSSDAPPSIVTTDNPAATDERLGKGNNGLKNYWAGEFQDAENDASPAPVVKLPSQGSRKGHKKSRQGCYNCKRRKIKV